MTTPRSNNVGNHRSRPGIVLLVTLILLVVLATLGYTLSVRVAAQRYRSRYVIDYQAARSGRDSAVKYALATLEDISPQLISRPNEPDFSDLFYLSEEQYREILEAWAEQKALQEEEDFEANNFDYANRLTGGTRLNDFNDMNGVNDVNYFGDGFADFNDPNSLVIPGPYGPPWPFVTQPAEFEIGSAKVRIEIEDENAKYPVGWMLVDDDKVQRETLAGFQTFCEWMDVNEVESDKLASELKEIAKMKPFKVEFRPIRKREPIGRQPTRRVPSRGSQRRQPVTRRTPGRYRTTTVSVSQQINEQAADLGKLLHSSLLDAELLARPTIISETRKESTLKYMGTWGSIKVNVNTAPRHVLEAAFMFGGDADKIAEEIIQRRRTQPFEDLDDLKRTLFRYSQAVSDCEKYITTVSNFFTVRVTAVSGVAKASTVIAITKDMAEDADASASASGGAARPETKDEKGDKKMNVVAIISS